jgi:hypothetical protein
MILRTERAKPLCDVEPSSRCQKFGGMSRHHARVTMVPSTLHSPLPLDSLKARSPHITLAMSRVKADSSEKVEMRVPGFF